MKKFLFLLLSSLLLFSMGGCNLAQKKLTETEINQYIVTTLEEKNTGAQNLKILATKDFRNKLVVVYSYQTSSGHFVNYGIFEEKGFKVELLGGGGGIGKTKENQQVTFSSGGSASPNPYYITYGEVFDPTIKKIKVVYSDNVSYTENVNEAGGYLIIRDGESTGIKTFEALDESSKTVYKIP